ncbi:hypothetical protein [Weissella thailandensis]|uniref:Membrane protein 6-pyruvoyl-tetrahydropterin synthase-related domain-containing protein n=1 Tax=Weissella thailandensis TaxID=89061 RepID=A0ABX9I3A5_9LACO|nr:hypothetical protein [Weissella thailandensis]NKY91753.1 hypothetical protein [Weissella thailandensis]RDS58710.1 hypothetical protein DWV05_09615 [Weissella thailandensis]GEP75541.1 hypothetical protein WTH01_17880 [Weissella thailandensis]
MSLYGFFKNKVNYIDIMLIVVLGIIATIVPFLSHFYNISTDGVYHLARFQSIADSLKDNSIPNTLNFKYVSQNSAIGVAINSLYPWLTGLIFIIPNLIFQNPIWGLAAGFLILNIITISTAKSLMSYISSSRIIIYTGVVIYQFNNYHFIDLYSRSAFGESIAYAFIPLVFLGILQIYDAKKTGFLVLGLGMGLLINTHIISFIFGLLIIFISILHRCVTKNMRRHELIAFCKAGLVGILIGLYAIYNLLDVYLLNNIVEPFKIIKMLDMNTMLTTLLNNDIKSENSIGWNLGLPVTILLISLLILAYKAQQNSTWKIWIISAGVIYLFIFNWWPTESLVNTPLSIIQFYGRLFVIIGLLISIGFVLFLNHHTVSTKRLVLLNLLIIAFSLSAVYQNHYNYWTYRQPLNSSNYYTTLKNRSTFSDYLPAKGSKTNVSVLFDENITVPKQKKLTNNSVSFKVKANKNKTVSLPVVMYNGKSYNIWVNNVQTQSLSTKLLRVKLTKGTNTIKLTSTNNKNELLLIVSVGSFIGFSSYLFFRNRKNKRQYLSKNS